MEAGDESLGRGKRESGERRIKKGRRFGCGPEGWGRGAMALPDPTVLSPINLGFCWLKY